MKNKKGESHLGFILSFVIFITFLLFVYTTLEPALKIRAGKQPVLDFLRFSLVDKFVIEDFTTMTITECVKITGGEIYDKANSGVPLKIKDDSENILSYKFQGIQLLIGLAQSYTGILKVYYGTGVDSSPTYEGGSAGCDQVDSVTNFVKTESQILLSGIIALKDSYETDYEQLKTDLNLPDGSDFTFSFELANGTIIEPTGVTIPSTDVYATTFPLEYLDSDANPQIGFLTIKVW